MTLFMALFGLFLINPGLSPAYAQVLGGSPTVASYPDPVTDAGRDHRPGRATIRAWITQQFSLHRDWLVTTFAQERVIPALQLFTEQMSAVAMQQTMIIGTFLDAKHQLETQRLFQELQVQAHKDYQPSTGFCAFGTNVRSLAHSESVGRYNALFMSQRQLKRHLGQHNTAGAKIPLNDKKARWEQFVSHYCDPQDNNWINGEPDSGLASVCRSSNSNRVNIDIDYTRAIENKRTIDVSRPFDIASDDELDTLALANNIFGHEVLFRDVNRSNILEPNKAKLYMALRSIAAKRNVAENSFNAIVGMKTLGSSAGLLDPAPGTTQTYKFLGAVLTELGIPEDEIDEYTGMPDSSTYVSGFSANGHFSYYAQLEILAKKIYQNPDFYANLYDKPANVKRISTALKAIELMVDRAIYESQIRQEMSMSVLLSSRLRMNFDDIDKNLTKSD